MRLIKKGDTISEPPIGKHPTEYFGYPYTVRSERARKAREKQFCPYLDKTCTKPRKSEPEIKVGICSVGYRGDFSDEHRLVILCPARMKTKRVFRDIERYIFREDQDDEVTSWVREVSMGVAGSIDHVLVKRKSYGKLAGGVKDFACVEFQAAGTTGSPYPAIEDYVKTGEFQERGYDYGINWANEFVKTMMQQVYKKGRKIEEWNKKMIWVIQDIALEYLESEYDTSGLRDATESDPIHFFTLKVAWENGKNKWILKSDKKKSTDISGIRKILLGPPPEKYPSLDEFKSEIEKKLRINKN